MDPRTLIPHRSDTAHKGNAGRVFVIAGQRGMIGAAALAARGALRGGAGLVTVGVADGVEPIVAAKLDDAMTLPLGARGATALGPDAHEAAAAFAAGVDAVAIGPGLGRAPQTRAFVASLIGAISCPTVLDADALFGLDTRACAAPLVLTPHAGEMARLLDRSTDDVGRDRRATADEAATRFGAVVVLKGAGTIVSDGTRAFANDTGGPALATGGTGDVLTGVIAALLGQGLAPFDAAVLGVHVHGLAGDLAATEHGVLATTASDVVDHLGAAWLALDRT